MTPQEYSALLYRSGRPVKEYTFATHYTILAFDEEKARETVRSVESQVRADMQVVAFCTRLTDIEDVSEEAAR